jgi:hypothetical protein
MSSAADDVAALGVLEQNVFCFGTKCNSAPKQYISVIVLLLSQFADDKLHPMHWTEFGHCA